MTRITMKGTLPYNHQHSLSYAEYGARNGYPLLIQHGLIASNDEYELFNRLILAGTRLICVARPGYGESSPYRLSSFAGWAELLVPLIEKLNLTQFDILAMSSGAPYGYSIGCRFAEKVRNIYIFSGIPALFDDIVLSHWPYEPIKEDDISKVEDLAFEIFFSHLTENDRKNNDVRDSMMNQGFGVAQDLQLRFKDWGFPLMDVKAPVYMRHSKCDESVPFQTAVRTSQLLPYCELELTDTGPHFSNEALDDFIRNTIIDKIK